MIEILAEYVLIGVILANIIAIWRENVDVAWFLIWPACLLKFVLGAAHQGFFNLLGFDDIKHADWEGDDDASHH